MVLLAISLYAILTSALDVDESNGTSHNNSYVECYTNEHCMEWHNNYYCYAGMCTDRCPPGYLQENSGSEPTFTCTCDTDKGFEEDGYFSGTYAGLKIPKCKCVKSYCKVTVYASGIGYTDGLIPRGSPPNCKSDTGSIPPILTSFIFYLVIGTMIIFTFINCRSASGVIYDFHRYIGLYVVASIAVIVFVQTVGPFTAGFTRSMGFGVIIHNSAEWNFLLRLHFGKEASVRNCTNMCVMLYYVLLLVAMVILPLEMLLWVSMVQGGILDWTLFFFLFVGGRTMKDEPNWQPVFNYCCTTSSSRFGIWYGLTAFFHLMTVQVLFFGFALNNPILIGLGSILLVPTFLSYTYFAYGEDRLSLLCGPSLVMNYKINESDSSDVTLEPFKHTTRTADILWQGLFRNQRTYAVTEAGSTKTVGDDENDETVKLIEPVGKSIVVEDCENFKFGVHDTVSKCCCGGSCLTWIPCYWVAAFFIVIVNATIIIYAPELFTLKDGCISGYDYGAW